MTKMPLHETWAIVLGCEVGDELPEGHAANLSQMVFPFHRSRLMNHFVEV